MNFSIYSATQPTQHDTAYYARRLVVAENALVPDACIQYLIFILSPQAHIVPHIAQFVSAFYKAHGRVE